MKPVVHFHKYFGGKCEGVQCTNMKYKVQRTHKISQIVQHEEQCWTNYKCINYQVMPELQQELVKG